MHMASAVLPRTRSRRGGVIVNVASDAAKTATPGESVIGAAKAAIVMFTRTIAIEEKRYGIRANAQSPAVSPSLRPGLHVEGDCLRPVNGADLAKDSLHVCLDRFDRDDKYVGDFGVGGAQDEPFEHLAFTVR